MHFLLTDRTRLPKLKFMSKRAHAVAGMKMLVSILRTLELGLDGPDSFLRCFDVGRDRIRA